MPSDRKETYLGIRIFKFALRLSLGNQLFSLIICDHIRSVPVSTWSGRSLGTGENHAERRRGLDGAPKEKVPPTVATGYHFR